MIIGKDKIKEMLPHREPFLMVDCVTKYKAKSEIETELFLDENLPFFAGHFPNNPIMPGVLTCEAMAQTAGLLISLSEKDAGNAENVGKLFYLASSNIKYLNIARAKETLTFNAHLLKDFQGLCQFEVEARSGRTPIAKGILVLASAENAAK